MLCGHSYGGMVITEVGARMTAHVSAILYLVTFLPSDNESVLDIAGPEIQRTLSKRQDDLAGSECHHSQLLR